jgi:hypothetical protein
MIPSTTLLYIKLLCPWPFASSPLFQFFKTIFLGVTLYSKDRKESVTMTATSTDRLLDGDGEHEHDSSHNTADNDAVWKKDASSEAPTTPERPGLVSLQDICDTDSSASVSSSRSLEEGIIAANNNNNMNADATQVVANSNVDAVAIRGWIEAAVAAAALTAANQQQELVHAAVATALTARRQPQPLIPPPTPLRSASVSSSSPLSSLTPRNDGTEPHDESNLQTPQRRGRSSLQEISSTKRSASASSKSRQMSNDNEENESNANIVTQIPSQRNLSGEPNRRRSKSNPPSPTRSTTLSSLIEENLPSSGGKHIDADYDTCSVTVKAMRLGLLIARTEDEDEAQAETRLTGCVDAYRLHLEKYIEPSVLANLLKITPRDVAGYRHATHQRRLDIFLLTFRSTFHTAWHCRCESVCDGGQFYCMDSEKQLEFYREQHNEYTPTEPNAQLCYSCYDDLMVRGGEAPHLELSQANLSTGKWALEMGCDSCYEDMGGEDLDSIGSLTNATNFLSNSKKSKENVAPIASEFGKGKGSILNRQDDPFAPREGKTLVWSGVSMTLVCKNKL